LTITVAGARYEIPYRPAAEWVDAVQRISTLASALADPGDREEIADLVLEHPRARDDLREESLRILTQAAGRAWWEAGRLLNTSLQPEVLGRLVLAGADAWQRSVGEWCAAVYALCVKGQDEKGRVRFDFTLSIPPPGYESAWDDGGGSDPMEFLASLKKG
jgi:hypothetical protein